jgi:YVTN family beta-propeller protein
LKLLMPAIVCAMSLTSAQWYETTLMVPDTLGRMLHPVCFSYDSANNTVYVGGDSCVIALDGETNEKTARVSVGSRVSDLCYVPQNNRIYSANAWSDNVTVIDGVTNSVISTLSAGRGPVAFCYNPQDNKIYSANSGSDDVTVIDGATDSVIATVGVGDHPLVLCYSPQHNKVYCANDSSGSVTVIDGATDSVVATIPTGAHPVALCYDPHDDKLYCANNEGNGVTVIDGGSDSVITTVITGQQPQALCFNDQNNTVYCADASWDTVTVIDGATDSITAKVFTGNGPWALCYDRRSNQVYCANYAAGTVTVIDGATNSVITTVGVGALACALCYNPTSNKVYCADRFGAGGGVTVLDGATNEVISTVITGDCPYALCYNPQESKVYCANAASGSVTIVGGVTNSIRTTVAAGVGANALCYNSQNNQVYCANRIDKTVTVIDGATDRVDTTIGTYGAPSSLCYNVRNNKVYANGGTVTVIDCATNQNIGPLSTGAGALCYNPRDNKLYCASQGVKVVDCATDSVVAAIATEDIRSFCYNPLNDKVYCAAPSFQEVVVIDGATNQVAKRISTRWPVFGMCYNVQNNRVYCADSFDCDVIDCASDSIITTVPLSLELWNMCYCATNNKVYGVPAPSYPPDSGDQVAVIAGAENKVFKGFRAKVTGSWAIEWNSAQNRIYVANYYGSSITVLRDYQGPPLGDLDVDPDSLNIVADTIRLRSPYLPALKTDALTPATNHMLPRSAAGLKRTFAVLPRQSAPVKAGVSAVVAPPISFGRSSAIGAGPYSDYAVGEFILANTSASYNPDSTDGPSQSLVDSLNFTGSLRGPGGTLDSIRILNLPESLWQGQTVVCTLVVYVPPGQKDSDYVGSIAITGRDTAGLVVAVRFDAIITSRLGDLDVDPDSLDVMADTIRLRVPETGDRIPGSPDRAVGAFVLANTSTSHNPDATDGPSLSWVDSLNFGGSLAGPRGTIDSILIPNLPKSLAQGQTAVCTLALSVPVGLPAGDYSGPIAISGYDSRHYKVAETVYALVQKLGDLDVDKDSLNVVRDTMDLHTQPAGPVYHPYAKAEFMLVNTSSAYNPDAEDGPSRSTLRQVEVKAEVEAQGRAVPMVNSECRIVKPGSGFHSSQFTLDSSAVGIYVLNLPESLAVGQAVECTLALVLPVGATPDGYAGWITISAVDTLGYQVRDSFALAVRGPGPRQNLDSLRVAPIPFKPNQNPEHDAIHFQGLSAGARVIVYDASGQSVWSATESGDGHLEWDAKVASGIYVYLVVSADGKGSKVGKLSVIR